MKIKLIKIILVSLLLVGESHHGYSQGSFVNLNFENPILPLTPVGFEVPIANAIPGWTGSLGNRVYYNTVSIGAAAISLQGPGSPFPPIAGNYSVVLQSAFGVAPDGTAAVGQIGQIPSTALSLRFYGDTNMQVTFIGHLLTLFELGRGTDYQIVGADISGFAGQTGELKFLMPDLTPVGSSSSYLDNIQFSTQSIPEPGTVGLFAIGTLFLGWKLQGQPKP